MKKRILLALPAALALASCGGGDTDTTDQTTTPAAQEETTTAALDIPMDGDTIGPTAYGDTATRTVTYTDGTVETAIILTGWECGLDADTANADLDEWDDPYEMPDGKSLCRATIRYENIGNNPNSMPEAPTGYTDTEGRRYQQTADYDLYVINDRLMTRDNGSPFNPGDTWEVQHLIEVTDGITIESLDWDADDTGAPTRLAVQ
ncbi:hypothetical protein [Actinobaculum sp. 352]|uniref:hypothetical protein n=1 Tax=Actinobaculum sp. 352 TaxID=2490946 RepID=UPI000F7F32EB|nr:hypothetical protein [Actinobaculum sp. 352]RTE49361.1 hypothetical protein EKN07_07275 [Actinobaculum sp. 352]